MPVQLMMTQPVMEEEKLQVPEDRPVPSMKVRRIRGTKPGVPHHICHFPKDSSGDCDVCNKTRFISGYKMPRGWRKLLRALEPFYKIHMDTAGPTNPAQIEGGGEPAATAPLHCSPCGAALSAKLPHHPWQLPCAS